MKLSSTNPSIGTPVLVVRCNRGLAVRTLTYNRQSVEDTLDERIERTTYDALGRMVSRTDARFYSAGGPPNVTYVSSLSARVLRTDSVDAGTQWALVDVDGRLVWTRDARSTVTTWTYDALGRPLTAADAPGGQEAVTRDVWIYGEAQADAQKHNLRGRCVRRYDTGGRLAWSGFRLTGQPLDETRQLLADAEADADWPGSDESAWASALDTTPYLTAWSHDATGIWVTQTDAKGNVQERACDVAGRLASGSLALAGGKSQAVLSAIGYSAAGQVLSETAGNGAVALYTYEPQTQRLIGLMVTRPVQAGRAMVVQNLSYEYDPVGNVLSMSDGAQTTSYWRNQAVAATQVYSYDALYHLVSATGRETANRGRQGDTLPPATIPLPSDDSVYTNYSRTYTYDRGGNLTTFQHQGATNYTQTIVVSDRSNHALLQNATDNLQPGDIDNGSWFDPSGNQQLLLPDSQQPLGWNSRNRLEKVTLVKRSGKDDDREVYQYGSDGMRVRKRMCAQTSGVTRIVEAIYLPGLTLRSTSSDNGNTVTVTEALQEVESEAGSIHARCLHWDTGLSLNLANDQTRYGMGGQSGSVRLELDDQASVISREEFYPYGGTAVWTARSQVEADTKFVRYSNKERDVTGLYYFGHRYYQPWIGQWMNPGLARIADGRNFYRMARNNPVTVTNRGGLRLQDESPQGATSQMDVSGGLIPRISTGRDGESILVFEDVGIDIPGAMDTGAYPLEHRNLWYQPTSQVGQKSSGREYMLRLRADLAEEHVADPKMLTEKDAKLAEADDVDDDGQVDKTDKFDRFSKIAEVGGVDEIDEDGAVENELWLTERELRAQAREMEGNLRGELPRLFEFIRQEMGLRAQQAEMFREINREMSTYDPLRHEMPLPRPIMSDADQMAMRTHVNDLLAGVSSVVADMPLADERLFAWEQTRQYLLRNYLPESLGV